MARAYNSTVLDAPVDAVWQLLADFGGWHRWSSQIDACRLEDDAGGTAVGAIRQVDLPGGHQIRERLVACDSALNSLSYDFPGAIPFPVRSFLATVRLHPVQTDNATFIEWFGEYDADAAAETELREIFVGGFTSFFDDLKAAASTR